MTAHTEREGLRVQVADLQRQIVRLRAENIAARDKALEEAASVVEELRHRDIQMRDAVDAGEGYDLAIDEAGVAIRALKGAKP